MKNSQTGSINVNMITNASKAYDNKEFIHSSDGRLIRIISEYLYPEKHLRKNNIKRTIIFFGSARAIPKSEFLARMGVLKSKLYNANDKEKARIQNEIDDLNKISEISDYYDQAYELAKRIAEWSGTLPKKQRFHIASGGGPGIMEAANKGAHDAGDITIGFNISLPHEQLPNQFIDRILNFEFHYFFMRKFWLVYPSQVLIVFPGGFGTIDEMMEVLTLRQTNKMKKPRIVLLYSESY